MMKIVIIFRLTMIMMLNRLGPIHLLALIKELKLSNSRLLRLRSVRKAFRPNILSKLIIQILFLNLNLLILKIICFFFRRKFIKVKVSKDILFKVIFISRKRRLIGNFPIQLTFRNCDNDKGWEFKEPKYSKTLRKVKDKMSRSVLKYQMQ